MDNQNLTNYKIKVLNEAIINFPTLNSQIFNLTTHILQDEQVEKEWKEIIKFLLFFKISNLFPKLSYHPINILINALMSVDFDIDNIYISDTKVLITSKNKGIKLIVCFNNDFVNSHYRVLNNKNHELSKYEKTMTKIIS